MKNPQTNKQPRRAAGFGMVEVLVTLVLLSVGLMGIAKLQLISLRAVHASTVRGQAVLLAYDLADRMRANRFGVVDLNGAPVGFYNRADAATYEEPSDNNCTQGAGAADECTIDEMAAHDIQEWDESIADLLPGGLGWVCVDSDSSDDSVPDPFDDTFEPTDLAVPLTCDNVLTDDPVTGTVVYSITLTWADVEAGGAVTKSYIMRFQL